MARMPKNETKSPQTADSIAEVVRQLQLIVRDLESQCMQMQVQPVVEVVHSPWTTSLKDGLWFLRNWTDGVRDSVAEARMAKLGVSGFGDVSANGAETAHESTKNDNR